MERGNLPAKEVELARYNKHRNDINDEGYKGFVSPLVNAVFEHCQAGEKGLDFGAGPGPVVSKLLQDKGFQIAQYDPFFHNFPELLEEKYDFIVSCEVIEHFHHPAKEFELLKKMLAQHGKLFLMTSIYKPSIDFGSWYYKNDFTHVFFYQKETFEYIRAFYGFSGVEISGNLIVYVS